MSVIVGVDCMDLIIMKVQDGNVVNLSDGGLSDMNFRMVKEPQKSLKQCKSKMQKNYFVILS